MYASSNNIISNKVDVVQSNGTIIIPPPYKFLYSALDLN